MKKPKRGRPLLEDCRKYRVVFLLTREEHEILVRKAQDQKCAPNTTARSLLLKTLQEAG